MARRARLRRLTEGGVELAAHPRATGVRRPLRVAEEAVNSPEAAGGPGHAAMGGGGPPYALGAGHCIVELLTVTAPGAGCLVVAGQGVGGVRAGDQGGSIVFEGCRAVGNSCLERRDLLNLAGKLFEGGTFEELTEVPPLFDAVTDAQLAMKG